MEKLLDLLKSHELRKTSIRQQVLQIFMDAVPQALSSQDIENQLNKVDRVTLYRTLKSFEDAGLVHLAIDGSGKQKYALCSSGCTVHHHTDQHAHFYCNKCNQTICLDQVSLPPVKVPEQFKVDDAQLVLSGTCKDCI